MKDSGSLQRPVGAGGGYCKGAKRVVMVARVTGVMESHNNTQVDENERK